VWADFTRAGTARILTARPGGRTVVRQRFQAPPRRGRVSTIRVIRALSVSGGRVAAIVDTCSGVGLLERCAARAFAGPLTGRLAPLGAPLPRQGPSSCPRPPRREPQSIATGGGWTVVAEARTCRLGLEGSADAAGAGDTRIVARKGSRRRVLATTGARGLRIAGPYLAWIEGAAGGGNRIVLYDLRRGEQARRVASGGLEGSIEVVDVQDDGTLAYVHRVSADNCVELLRLGGSPERLGCDASPELIAVAAGRALYRLLDDRLMLAEPGSPAQQLAPSAAGFDLASWAAAWAVRGQGGSQTIFLQRLG
jgi:hypothetical protein